MSGDMVRMRVTNKYFFGAELRLVRIEPELKFGNVQVAGSKFDSRKRHGENVSAHSLKSINGRPPEFSFALDFFRGGCVNFGMAEKGINDLPRELRMLFTRGSDAFSRENYDYAIDLFTQILAKEPTNYDVRKLLRASQLRKAGGGGGLLKKLWGDAKSSPMIAKAQIPLHAGNFVEALQIAEQVLNKEPQNSAAHRIVVEAASLFEWYGDHRDLHSFPTRRR